MIRIRELRKANCVTAKKLGEAINVAESTISLYENGKRAPDYETLMRIADYFHVTVDYLLGREEKAPAFAFDERTEKNVAKILALIADFSDDQLDFLISVMEEMPHLSDNQLKVVTSVMRNMRK